MNGGTEQERLAALRELEILDTPPEAAFDGIVELASRLLAAPIALVSLLDDQRQWFKARLGIDEEGTPRALAFCDEVITRRELVVIEDARRDERFADHPDVTGAAGIRFYAGAPVRGPHGHAVGTLCVLDRHPRTMSEEDRRLLLSLADQVSTELRLRWAGLVERDLRRELADATDRMTTLARRNTQRLDSAVLAVVIHIDGEVRYANPAAARLWGVAAPHDVVGRSLLDTIEPARRPMFVEWQERFRQGDTLVARRRPFIRADGTVITVEAHGSATEWEDQPAVQIEMRDVSGEEEAEQARRAHLLDLAALNTELVEAVAVKDHLLATVSHDIRAPLTSILGFADLLGRARAHLSDEERELALGSIARQARRLDLLVSDLLSVTAVESGDLPLQRAPVTLAPVVQQLVADLQLDPEVRSDIPPDLVASVDVERLHQVLTNLLSNASRYGAPPVVVRAVPVGEGWIDLSVTDSGPGVPMDFVPRLFEKMAVADRQVSRAVGGTGLGLAIVRALARAHGGDARYEPAMPGARFVVRLPARS